MLLIIDARAYSACRTEKTKVCKKGPHTSTQAPRYQRTRMTILSWETYDTHKILYHKQSQRPHTRTTEHTYGTLTHCTYVMEKQHTQRKEGQDLPKVIRTNDRRSTLLSWGLQWRDVDNRRHGQSKPTHFYCPTIPGNCDTLEQMHHLNFLVHIIRYQRNHR